MPKIDPPGGDVSWPKNQGVLGVVGVAPWATLDFCNALYKMVRARKDWDYPRVLLDINTKLPSRGRHLQLGERDPSPYIAETIEELASAGATVAVVICNTAHILYERWAKEPAIPILNIIDETVKLASRSSSSVVPLVSASMASRDLYGKALGEAGLSVVRVPAEIQVWVEEVVESVKVTGHLGKNNELGLTRLLKFLDDIQGVKTVVLGCTELSRLEMAMKSHGHNVADSNKAIALSALSVLGFEVE
jgi:aspartate racemase